MLNDWDPRGPRALLFVVSVCIFFVAACGGSTPPSHRDLLLITVDTLRHDGPGFSGAGKAETPLLDRLAATGSNFTDAHAHAVVTLPSHASILTGLLPFEHGIRDNAGFVLDESIPTLATHLASAGYATAAFVSAFPLDRRFGLENGFDTYDDAFGGTSPAALTFAERPGESTVQLALDWWRGHADEPRFLWVHLFTPHFPYEPGEPFASRYRDAPYYGEVARTDRQLAPLLEPLLATTNDPPLVVLTSDHGESLGEHGEKTHGLFAYEATLKVPLVFWSPGLVPAAKIDSPARHVDIVPTVLELLGLGAPAGLAGESLFADPGERGDHDTYFEALSASLNRGWAPLQGVISGGRKAIRLPIPELYELSGDPEEMRNLADRHPAELESALGRLPAEASRSSARTAPDEEEIARLRSLGYVAGASAPADAYGPEDDPKRLLGSEHALEAALDAYRRGDLEDAARRLEQLIDEQPRMTIAYAHLGALLVDAGRIDAAVTTLERAVARGVDNEEIRVKLALALGRIGRGEEGRRVLEADAGSPNPGVQSALGRLAALAGEAETAEMRFLRALELDPTYPAALSDLGILKLERGDPSGAREYLERALSEDEMLSEAWNALGVVRLQGKDVEGAVEAWRRAVGADPRYPDALFNLSLALGRTGSFAEAADYLERYVGLTAGPERERGEQLLREFRGRAEGSG